MAQIYKNLVFELAGAHIKTIRAMLAPTLAAIPSLEVILLGENDVSLLGVVIIFTFYFTPR